MQKQNLYQKCQKEKIESTVSSQDLINVHVHYQWLDIFKT